MANHYLSLISYKSDIPNKNGDVFNDETLSRNALDI